MIHQNLGRLSRVLGVILVGCWSVSSHAHIPSFEFVIKSSAQKHVGFSVIRMVSQLTLPNQQKIQEQLLFDTQTQTLRLRYLQDSDLVFSPPDRKLSGGGLGTLTFGNSTAEWTRALRERGISSSADRPAQRRLVRINPAASNPVAWVFGSTSELWIEKDAFLPLSLRTPGWKVDWLNWAWSREYPFSKSMVLQMSDKIWKAEVVEIAVNADAVEQKKFGAAPGEQNSNLSSEELDQLRKWVEICR